MKRLVALSTLALGTAFAAQPALAAPPPLDTTPGHVIALANTPQLFIADEQGVVHFAGDPRALAGRMIAWTERTEVSLAELRAIQRGDPWLTAGLVKVGDAIYLPQWDGTAAAPTLGHVQSPDDLAILGINGANYHELVLDQSAWERQYGLQVSRLPVGELQLAVPAPAPAAADTTESPPPSDTEHVSGLPADEPQIALPPAPAATESMESSFDSESD